MKLVPTELVYMGSRLWLEGEPAAADHLKYRIKNNQADFQYQELPDIEEVIVDE